MAVATQEVFAHSDKLVEIWDMGAAAPERTLVANGARYGVSLTNTASITGNVASKSYGPYTFTQAKQGGVGNGKATAIDATDAAPVAVDGTWEFEGAITTGSTPTPTSTAQGVLVYVTSGGVVSTSSSGNTLIGHVNYPATYTKVAGTLPVKIGA